MLAPFPRLIGMVHVGALPGTPRGHASVADLAADAAREAAVLADAGFDAVLVENMHDLPYLRRDVGPEIVASMTAVVAAVRASVSIPVGVQVLAGANRAAVAVAHATGCPFIRAEGFVFASVADEGLLEEADAGPLLRERSRIRAEVDVFADIKKKHSSHALTSDVSLAETARAAVFSGADAVIVTGGATGEATSLEDVRDVAHAVSCPVLVGSGVTPDKASSLLDHADALIVGSWIKQDGAWQYPVDEKRARELVNSVR